MHFPAKKLSQLPGQLDPSHLLGHYTIWINNQMHPLLEQLEIAELQIEGVFDA